MTLTEKQARVKWLSIRQAMEGVIEYDDAWTVDMIDNHENEIIEVILSALFEASENPEPEPRPHGNDYPQCMCDTCYEGRDKELQIEGGISQMGMMIIPMLPVNVFDITPLLEWFKSRRS